MGNATLAALIAEAALEEHPARAFFAAALILAAFGFLVSLLFLYTGAIKHLTLRWLTDWNTATLERLGPALFFVALIAMSLANAQRWDASILSVVLAVSGAAALLVSSLVFAASIAQWTTPLDETLAQRQPLTEEEFGELFGRGEAARLETTLAVCRMLDDAIDCGDLRRLRPDDPIRDLYFNPKTGEGIPDDVALRLKHAFGVDVSGDELMDESLTLPQLVERILDAQRTTA